MFERHFSSFSERNFASFSPVCASFSCDHTTAAVVVKALTAGQKSCRTVEGSPRAREGVHIALELWCMPWHNSSRGPARGDFSHALSRNYLFSDID